MRKHVRTCFIKIFDITRNQYLAIIISQNSDRMKILNSKVKNEPNIARNLRQVGTCLHAQICTFQHMFTHIFECKHMFVYLSLLLRIFEYIDSFKHNL